MSRSIRSWLPPLFACLLVCPSLAFAQEPPSLPPDVKEASRLEREAIREAERRAAEARAERERRAREAEASRRRREELRERNSPEALARKEARENYYRTRRLQGFLKDLREFGRQAFDLRTLRFAPMSKIWAVRDLDRRSRNLEKKTQDILKFIDSGSDAPELEVGSLPTESLDKRLNRIAGLAQGLVPQIIELTTGDLLDVALQREVRRNLYLMRAFVRDLPE